MNSVRDNVKNAVSMAFDAINSETSLSIDYDADTLCTVTDNVFEALGITEDEQDIEGAAVVVNPVVDIDIVKGIPTVQNMTDGIKLNLRDYDVDDPSEECVKTDDNGNHYINVG